MIIYICIFILMFLIVTLCIIKGNYTNWKYGEVCKCAVLVGYDVPIRKKMKKKVWFKYTDDISFFNINKKLSLSVMLNPIIDKNVLKDVDIIFVDDLDEFSGKIVDDVSSHIHFFDSESLRYRYGIVIDIKRCNLIKNKDELIYNLILHEYLHIINRSRTQNNWDEDHSNCIWKTLFL